VLGHLPSLLLLALLLLHLMLPLILLRAAHQRQGQQSFHYAILVLRHQLLPQTETTRPVLLRNSGNTAHQQLLLRHV
jgi:hypothetical protein